MNLPNRLSLARIVAVPVLLLFLLIDRVVNPAGNEAIVAACRFAGLLLAIAVTYTDWLDGKIARERGIETNLGKLLDPLADKIFVTAALVAFVELGMIPAWAVVLVVAREFLVTGLRSIAMERGRVMAADRLGKHKTGWQLGLIITAATVLAARDILVWAGVWHDPLREHWYAEEIITGMVWFPLTVSLALTVWSGWNYLATNRDLLTE